jgi:ureidoacrylate peracid hydrolase
MHRLATPHPVQLTLDPQRTALLLIDLQNDAIHPNGAYARHGVVASNVSNIPAKLQPLAQTLRQRGGWIVSTHFTILTGLAGQPLISDHVKRLRPFLSANDFAPGSWGHQLVDELAPSDLQIEKVAHSAFYMSRLEWVLWQAKIDTLLVAGVATHASVSATLRDALMRDFRVIVVEDGCAAFDPEVHRGALKELSAAAPLLSSRELIELLH